jgi:hypothetical protein
LRAKLRLLQSEKVNLPEPTDELTYAPNVLFEVEANLLGVTNCNSNDVRYWHEAASGEI